MAGTEAEAALASPGRLTGLCGAVWPLAMSGHGAGGVGQLTRVRVRVGACARDAMCGCAGRPQLFYGRVAPGHFLGRVCARLIIFPLEKRGP